MMLDDRAREGLFRRLLADGDADLQQFVRRGVDSHQTPRAWGEWDMAVLLSIG
jgi:hypothetical protein